MERSCRCAAPLSGKALRSQAKQREPREIKALSPRLPALQLGGWRLYSAHLFGAAAAAGAAGPALPSETVMLVTPAFAQAASPFGGDNMLVSLLPFILIFVIMYFLILRPQQKRQKQHQEMVKNVRRGDTVVTSGGLVGKVTKVIDDDQVEVELAEDVRVRQMRSMLADVRAKGEPVKEEGASS
jgi:preprotein translocase subunit YajC